MKVWGRNRLQTFLNPLKQAIAEPSPHTSCWVAPGPGLEAICRSLYNLCQRAPDRTQVEAGLGLHHPGNSRACTCSGHLQTTLEHHSITSTSHGGRWLLARHQSQSYRCLYWVNPSHRPADSNQDSSTRGESIQTTWRVYLEYTTWEIGEAVPLDPIGHLLH